MALIDDLLCNVWKEADIQQQQGFLHYTIIRSQAKSPGQFVFAVKKFPQKLEDDGDVMEEACEEDLVLETLTLDGARGKRNPLRNLRNCSLKVDSERHIIGVDVDGDCVVRIM